MTKTLDPSAYRSCKIFLVSSLVMFVSERTFLIFLEFHLSLTPFLALL